MKIINYCFSCHKEHDVTGVDAMAKGLKCECGGYYITPSGKVQTKLIPETDEDYKLLGQKKMIKVWTIYLDGQAGWTTDSPIEFIDELCEESGFSQIEVENILKMSVEQSKPGDSDHIGNYKIKCSEMEEEAFKNLEEFTGW